MNVYLRLAFLCVRLGVILHSLEMRCRLAALDLCVRAGKVMPPEIAAERDKIRAWVKLPASEKLKQMTGDSSEVPT